MIIHHPLSTEKSIRLMESDNMLVFIVDKKATKPQIKKAIEDWTLQRNKMEVFHNIAKAVIPCGPVLDTLEALTDPHFTQRGMIFDTEHPQRGKHKMLGMPVKMSKSKMEYEPAPLLGQHNEEVLKELLGYSKEKVAELKEEGIV